MRSYLNIGTFNSRKRKFRFKIKIFTLHNLLKLIFFGLLSLIFFGFIVIVWFSKDLPTPGKLANPDLKDSTKILDKNDELLYSMYKDVNRAYIPLNDIPKNLRDATIVVEDEDFYRNQGFSIKGYLRAFRDIIFQRRIAGGGSTLTQQLVKNVLLSPEQSITRKIKELILAVQVDQRYSKDQILEMYLNNIPYGGTAVGVETASDLYFGKHAKELTLSEASFLAGLPQAPSYYSPFTGEDKAYLPRTKYVLERMEIKGLISKQQKEKSIKEVESFTFSQNSGSIKAPHFVMYIREQLVELFGENVVSNGNLQVKTTLDYNIQKESEKIVKEEIDKLKGYDVGNGSAIVLDSKSGAILSMVGSKDYFDIENDGNFNAALSPRQPGSSLKPLTYAVAFESGYTPATLLMDAKTEFQTDNPEKPYIPVNYDDKYRGPVQVRFALGNSLNIPAVKMLAKVGIKPVMQKANDMGVESWKPTQSNMQNTGLSLVLGGREVSLLNLTSVYSAFANEGVIKEPFSIIEVKDSKGKTLYKHEDTRGVNVLSKEVSFLISHILMDSNAREGVFGRVSWLDISGKTVAAKTGTTDQKRDNWTVGYTPSLVVGVWVGNNDNSPMNQKIASGVTGASPIWNKIMKIVLKDKKNEEFKKPDNVIAMEIDSLTGGLPIEGREKRSEYFIKGTEPTTVSQIYKKIKLSKHQSNKLANQDEIDRGEYEVKEYIVFQEQDPVSTDDKNRWQEGIDAWIRSAYSADKWQYYPPTETSDHKYGDSRSSQNNSSPTPTTSIISPTPMLTPTLTPTPTIYDL